MKNRLTMPWPKEIYNYGRLCLEYVLFEYDRIPVTFVCLNEIGERFLCHCTDPINEGTWMVTHVDNDELATFIMQAEPLVSFWQNKKEVVLVRIVEGYLECLKYPGDALPDDELPAEDYAISGRHEKYVELLTAKREIIAFRPKKSENCIVAISLIVQGKQNKSWNAPRTNFRRMNVTDRKKNRIMG